MERCLTSDSNKTIANSDSNKTSHNSKYNKLIVLRRATRDFAHRVNEL